MPDGVSCIDVSHLDLESNQRRTRNMEETSSGTLVVLESSMAHVEEMDKGVKTLIEDVTSSSFLYLLSLRLANLAK